MKQTTPPSQTYFLYISRKKAFNTGQQQERFTLRKDDHGTRKCIAWFTFLHYMFSLLSLFLNYGSDAVEYRCSYSLIHQWMMNKPTLVFPGKTSPCSLARIEVAGADQVIIWPHIRLIGDCESGLTLQQFYYWNCWTFNSRTRSSQSYSDFASTQRW